MATLSKFPAAFLDAVAACPHGRGDAMRPARPLGRRGAFAACPAQTPSTTKITLSALRRRMSATFWYSGSL